MQRRIVDLSEGRGQSWGLKLCLQRGTRGLGAELLSNANAF